MGTTRDINGQALDANIGGRDAAGDTHRDVTGARGARLGRAGPAPLLESVARGGSGTREGDDGGFIILRTRSPTRGARGCTLWQ